MQGENQPHRDLSDGFILLGRFIMGSDLWRDKPASYLKIYLFIKMTVLFKTSHNMPRGSGLFANIHEKKMLPGISPDEWCRCLDYLRMCGLISTTRCSHGMIIRDLAYQVDQNPANYRAQAAVRAPQSEPQTLIHRDVDPTVPPPAIPAPVKKQLQKEIQKAHRDPEPVEQRLQKDLERDQREELVSCLVRTVLALKRDDKEGFSRTMNVARNKYSDMGMNIHGQTIIDEALAVVKLKLNQANKEKSE